MSKSITPGTASVSARTGRRIRRHVSAVKRGENSGRTLAHVDVVRGLEQVARSGSAGEIDVPIPWHCDRIAAVVQAADGRILGVAVQDAEPL